MTTQKFKTIDEYISTMPENVREILEKLRKLIKDEVPEIVEAISYNIPVFNLNGKYVIYFAGYKNHVSVYPIQSDGTPFEKELSQYVTGKGTAQFKLNEPIPYELVRKIVRFRADRSKQ